MAEMTRDQVLDKIQKLMRLATSPNEAEATLAMEKAAFFMEKHSLTLGDCQTEEEVTASMIRMDLKGRTMRGVMWEAVLANGIGECFDVKTVRYTKRDGWHLAFLGTKSDVDMTIYFTKYLRRTVGRITDVENQGMGRSIRNTFAHSMVNRIIHRMEMLYVKRQEIKTSDSLALVTVKKAATEAFTKKTFPRLRTGNRPVITENRSVWAKGQAAGDRVSLSKGVNGSQKMAAIG